MKTMRNIIEIDEEKCNGCGLCVPSCEEGALQIINGKAKLVKEIYCDGLGACLAECPQGALKVIQREADGYDEVATHAHVAQLKASEHRALPCGGGCPGSRAMSFDIPENDSTGTNERALQSELRQWPVQIHLCSPQAPYFSGRELVLMSTCGPIACADTHRLFLKGRSVVVGCPKLDNTDGYIEKLAAILSNPTIPKVSVVRMQVPCCGGLSMILKQAVVMSGRSDLAVEEITLSLQGNVLGARSI